MKMILRGAKVLWMMVERIWQDRSVRNADTAETYWEIPLLTPCTLCDYSTEWRPFMISVRKIVAHSQRGRREEDFQFAR